jgi:hypothetical protein
MSVRRNGSRVVVALSSAALVAVGIALSAPAGAVDRDVQPRSAGYQYGNWSQPGSGFITGSDDTMSQVYQLTWRGAFPDLAGTPGPVYAAGTFITSGSTAINRVGQWNGASWVPLTGDVNGIDPGVSRTVESGATVPGVYGMVLGGDDSIYAGGNFVASDTPLNNVGKWNGADWVAMGNGLRLGASGYNIQDMVMGNDFIGGDDVNYADDTVYAVGGFTHICADLANPCAQGATAQGIAQYSQSADAWYPLGTGTMSASTQAYAGAYIDDTLYVGGDFTQLNGSAYSRVAQWSDAVGAWRPLGAGLNNSIFAMAVHPTTKDLYVGGTFTQEVGGAANSLVGVAKWDYTDDTWYAVGTGLTGPNTDDISFSADGKTMWIGSWANAPTVSGTIAHGVAKLTSDAFIDSAATAITGSWQYLKSVGVSGVGGPSNGTINQTSTRAVLAQPSDTLLAAGNFHTAGPTSVGRVALFTPGPEPSPYDPVFPAAAPTDVVATGGWNKVTVDWTPPTYTGSYPITNYLVRASPGGRVCITRLTDPKLNQCTYTSLTPGIRYTFTVQALNGAGWGEESASSNVASPQNLKIRSYSRKKLNFFLGGGSEVTAGGIAPGYAAGTRIIPWVKIGDREWESAATSSLAVNSSASFTWKRKFNKKQNSTPMMVRFEIGGNFSNTVRIPGVR